MACPCRRSTLGADGRFGGNAVSTHFTGERRKVGWSIEKEPKLLATRAVNNWRLRISHCRSRSQPADLTLATYARARLLDLGKSLTRRQDWSEAPFHGGNTGSIPVGRANDFNNLDRKNRVFERFWGVFGE
jgi:hypothetical protein